MKTLYMTKGLPGSGKTTWALEQLKKNPGWKRVNKDDLRAMIDDGRHSKPNEAFVKKVRNFIIEMALREGCSVIVDDTNFHPSHERDLREIAKTEGAAFIVRSFEDVRVEVCIAQDLKRLRSVGEKVIRDMYYQHLSRQKPSEPIEQDTSLPPAIIVDIDGTLAIKGDRGPFEWSRVGEDSPNKPVMDVLLAINDTGASCPEIIIFSGRDGICRSETEKWLEDHDVPYDQLHMRPIGNTEKDYIVKQRMYDEVVKGKYYVRFVLDDRNQVVEMWRRNGLVCFQVAEGNF